MSLKYQHDDGPKPDETPAQTASTPIPTPVYTYVLIGSILCVFIVQCLTGGGLTAEIVGDARSGELAGFDKHAFLRSHEYWRILTGVVIHGGLIHVALNLYAFFNLGRIFEMLSNRAHLAIVFILAALGGNILSLLLMPDSTSVGASGGIVGLLGYITVYAFRRRQFINPAFRKNLLMNIGFMLIFGLVLRDVVDNFGHIGGLLTGALYALIQVPTDVHADPREAGLVAQIAGLGTLGVTIATCCFSILLLLRAV